jgi:hypothetical protein
VIEPGPPLTGQQQEEEQRRHLLAALARVRYALSLHCARLNGEPVDPATTARLEHDLAGAVGALQAPGPLAMLCHAFGLSPFERDLLLLCAGVELEGEFAGLCAQAMGLPAGERSAATLPTFSLALAALPGGHWDAITPEAPLRRYRLLIPGNAATLTMSPLRIDEPILHYLVGLPYRDSRLRAIYPLPPPDDELLPSQRPALERMLKAWSALAGGSLTGASCPILLLSGADERGLLAARACHLLGLHLSILPAALLPGAAAELELLACLWERQALLTRSALLLDCSDAGLAERGQALLIERFVRLVGTPLLLSCREPALLHLPGARAPAPSRLTLVVPEPPFAEQQRLWQRALGEVAIGLNGHIEQLALQFRLGSAAITAACAQLLVADGQVSEPQEIAHQLWEACRVQARPALEDLAQRIEPQATWEQLVLPEEQLRLLHEVVAQVRQRATVYERWGFGRQGARGLGISALFAGSSGTGKTLAAEVIAHELQLDLYRIDLSAVVSKYIGETEKNLRRIFDAAEQGGAILLFDEADALFGKRSEVKDSHDRYANIEVSYLLQRMETYRGLAILTTNLKHALDPAFLRRIRFIVHFPFPDAAMRQEIWRRIFPPALPHEGLELEKLAQLHVAGGNIRNIALYAAFLAAEAGEPLRMSHLLRAAAVEYAKLEKPLTEAEVGGWL